MGVKANVVANYAGQSARGLASIVLVPIYIKVLGIQAYGLIGIFIVLQSWLLLFDMGLTPTMAREMARFTAGAHNARSIGDLLRSVEAIAVVIAAFISCFLWGTSDWLAANWLNVGVISQSDVAAAISVMGVVVGLRLVEDIFASALVGLQRQVANSLVMCASAFIQSLGAVAVLLWVSPTIQAFFVWQAVVSLGSVLALRTIVYRSLPRHSEPPRFSLSSLQTIKRFAAGITATMFLALLLTQVDKVLLSKLISLEEFAHYALASAVAGALFLLVSPITMAFFPIFSELTSRREERELAAAYHRAAQLVTVLVGTGAILLMVFGRRILVLWTNDVALSDHVEPLLTVLALGSMLNALNWIPYQLQLAHAWTSLVVKTNIVCVVVLVPTILWTVPRYGAIGAAWIWVTLNAGYLIFQIYFMHRRILPDEKWRWYFKDVALPLVGAGIAALFWSFATRTQTSRIAELFLLAIIAACVLTAGALAATTVRTRALQLFLEWRNAR